MPLPPPPLAFFLTCSLFFSTACFLSNFILSLSPCLSVFLPCCMLYLSSLLSCTPPPPPLGLFIHILGVWTHPLLSPIPLELLSNINRFSQSASGLWGHQPWLSWVANKGPLLSIWVPEQKSFYY